MFEKIRFAYIYCYAYVDDDYGKAGVVGYIYDMVFIIISGKSIQY
jgi:hypothetical protein